MDRPQDQEPSIEKPIEALPVEGAIRGKQRRLEGGASYALSQLYLFCLLCATEYKKAMRGYFSQQLLQHWSPILVSQTKSNYINPKPQKLSVRLDV